MGDDCKLCLPPSCADGRITRNAAASATTSSDMQDVTRMKVNVIVEAALLAWQDMGAAGAREKNVCSQRSSTASGESVGILSIH